ncbi:MAG: Fic family protein [Flavobacteriales bacterium]|nr:Fic family protein [Flavobacteriales bacterium]
MKREHEDRLWQKLSLEWNYNSNHIEGNTLTYGETMLLLVHGQVNGGHSMREFEEMKAHDLAVSMVRDWAKDAQRDLNEADVRTLNQVLLKEPFWKEAVTSDGGATSIRIFPGRYKEQANNVRLPNGGVFLFATVEETPAKMQELMAWYAGSSDLHPVVRAALFHHRFVLIHPFGDGNGRTARLVVNYILMRTGMMPLVIKSADKRNYLRVLQQADAGDLEPFTEYLALREIEALELGIKAAKGNDIEEDNDLRKQAQILLRKAQAEKDQGESTERKWRMEAANWISVNFDEILMQLDQSVLHFEEFFKDNKFRILSNADGKFEPLNIDLRKATKSILLDYWNRKRLSVLSFAIQFGSYKFEGVAPRRHVLFNIEFGPEGISITWKNPSMAVEFLSYHQHLHEQPIAGLKEAGKWVLEAIEKAQRTKR